MTKEQVLGFKSATNIPSARRIANIDPSMR
jgi:hypothetical protein